MILLDTNVVSALMAPAPPRSVIEWLNRQESVTVHLSTITIAEIAFGVAVLPEGRRRRSLAERFDTFVVEGFEQRVLDFDRRAALLYGDVMSRRRAMGRPLSALDGQIAAIARANHLSVATRNVRNFEHCDLDLINPFEAELR
jgi:hypothetical protein